MARKFIVPTQDASLYQEFKLRNAGFDEILEVGKSDDGTDSIRALIQFDVTGIAASIISGTIPLDAEFFLNLRVANATNLQQRQRLEFWAVSESWDEGTGFFYQDLANAMDGVTWDIRDSAETTWSLAGGTTGSISASFVDLTTAGFLPTDIRLDITGLVQQWMVGLNDGLLIKLPESDEAASRVQSNIKFFSRNSHTVFLPTLEAVWVDQTFDTAGNCGLVLAQDEFELMLPDVRKEYITGSTNRVRVNARSLQPVKSFYDRFRFSNDFILQSGSMYSVVDEANGGVVIPFDSGSLLSADKSGSFFNLKIENMYRNRTYRILIQVPKSWGPEVIDSGHRFKVV